MRLLTHNMLTCTIKGVKNGYPLRIEATTIETCEADFHEEFLRNVLPKLEWAAFYDAAVTLGCAAGLTAAPPTDELMHDEAYLRAFHHALLEVHLTEGALVCPETGRRFPVSNGIPNMLLNEDEVQ